MDLSARIRGIKYKPLLCKKLEIFNLEELENALNSCASFILKIDKDNNVAISWWVSPKRTRSHPYARVYDTLSFAGKKITIIPIIKDEGKDGDRDFLQWDTVSLMSLLGIYVVVAYYHNAKKSLKYMNKITNQRFDINYIKTQIQNILSYQSDALHWNLEHIGNVGQIGQKALESYKKISKELNVEMHSWQSAEERINELLKGKNEFLMLSRKLSEMAQRRESLTVQPKECLSGLKATITIQNYLGGYYYFTADEVKIDGGNLFIIEGKHSQNNTLPSIEDVKDGLLKMILFTNLEDVRIDNKKYQSIAILKLTVRNGFDENRLSQSQKETLKILLEESKINNFQVFLF